MKSILTNIILSLLLPAFAAITHAGQEMESRVAPAISHVSLAVAATDKSPQPDARPHFTQGKALELNLRVDVSSKAILATDRITLGSVPICLLVDSLVNQFTQGIYLRYRPRDPPLA